MVGGSSTVGVPFAVFLSESPLWASGGLVRVGFGMKGFHLYVALRMLFGRLRSMSGASRDPGCGTVQRNRQQFYQLGSRRALVFGTLKLLMVQCSIYRHRDSSYGERARFVLWERCQTGTTISKAELEGRPDQSARRRARGPFVLQMTHIFARHPR